MTLLAKRRAITDAERKEAFALGDFEYDVANDDLGLTNWYPLQNHPDVKDIVDGRFATATNLNLYDQTIEDVPNVGPTPVFRSGGGSTVRSIETRANPMDILLTHGTCSISYWARRTAPTQGIIIVEQRNVPNYFFLDWWTNGTLYYGVGSNWFQIVDTTTEWLHLAMVVDLSIGTPAGMKCYRNAIDFQQNVHTPVASPMPMNLTQGPRTTENLYGEIFDLRISSKAWSPEQVRQIYEEPWRQAKPLRPKRRFFPVGETAGPVFPTPDNFLQAGGRVQDLTTFWSYLLPKSSRPPESDGTLIWDYEPLVSFQPSDWQTALDELGTNAAGRPIGANNWATTLPAPFGFPNATPQDMGIRHPSNYEQPTMPADGWFHCTAYSDFSNQHTQIAYGVRNAAWNSPYLLPYPQRHRLYLNFEFLPDPNWDDFTDILLIDLLDAGKPPGWTAGDNPSISFQACPQPGSECWRLWIRGANVGSTSWDHTTSFDVPWTTIPLYGIHELILDVQLDMSGTNSYTGCWLDGRRVTESTLANAVNSNVNPGELFPKIGNYWLQQIALPPPSGQTVRVGKHQWYTIPDVVTGGIGTMQIEQTFKVS